MSVEPFDWNVVVVGYWNPAILTPGGIAKRLFGLSEGKAVMVEVPLDSLAPYRVRYDGMIVTADSSRLAITTEAPNLTNLAKAKQIASCAIQALPETPFSAAGYNVRFTMDEPTPRIAEALTAPIDSLLSDADRKIIAQGLRRTVEFGEGVLNLEVSNDSAEDFGLKVGFNFDLKSSSIDEIQHWLETPIDHVRESVSSILKSVFEIPFQEEWQ